MSQFIGLSKQDSIELDCEICGARTIHKPVERLFALDKYTVECGKCGRYAIAEWRGLEQDKGILNRFISFFQKIS